MAAKSTPLLSTDLPPKDLAAMHADLAVVFNEGAKRYAADPASFSAILDAEGKPVTDLRRVLRALRFLKLYDELALAGKLP